MSAVREFTVALSNWRTTVAYLMVQYIGYRARTGRLSTLYMIAEPLIFIAGMYMIRGVVRGAVADYGTSVLLFLVTGFLPFYLFLRTSILSRNATSPRQPLPRIKAMDVFLAQVATNAVLWIVVLALLHVGMWIYGIRQAVPESLTTCAMALTMLTVLGAGVGLLNGAIARFFPFWLKIYGILTRGLLFFSGVLHIPDFYSLWIREWMVWNPIMHGVTWYRVGVFGNYPSHVLDEFYLVKVAVIMVFIGFIAERASLRYGGR
jgi:capsular polysaccharide transport system permease protein